MQQLALEPLPQAGTVFFRTIELQRIEREGQGRAVYLGQGERGLTPEEAALEYYARFGYKGLQTENTYWWMVMTLLFWDVIFARLPDVSPSKGEFPSLMQDMPSDFFTDEFYRRREKLIDNRIAELNSVPSLSDIVRQTYHKQRGKPCRPIDDWNKFTVDDICHGIESLEKSKLFRLMDRLLRDFNNNRSGLPDLFFYSPEPLFVEAKGDSDSLRGNQSDWHHFLSSAIKVPVEVLLINHSDRKVKSIIKKHTVSGTDVTISFGKSTSKNREEAINLAKSLPSYSVSGEGKDCIHTVEINTADISTLVAMLDLTKGWKSQKITVNGKSIHSGTLRDSIYCFKTKHETGAASDYCKEKQYDTSRKNLFGCRRIEFKNLEGGRWLEYGYVDTRNGEWVFDKDAIRRDIEAQIEGIELCPLFDPKGVRSKIESEVNKLPDRVNPMSDNSWGFIDSENRTWVYNNGKWQREYSWQDEVWPGYSLMVGIRKYSDKERKDDFRFRTSTNENFVININSNQSKQSTTTNAQNRLTTVLAIAAALLFFYLISLVGK